MAPMHFPLSLALARGNAIAPNGVSLHRNAHACGTTKRLPAKESKRGEGGRGEERRKKGKKHRKTEHLFTSGVVAVAVAVAAAAEMRSHRESISLIKGETGTGTPVARQIRAHAFKGGEEIHACSLQTEAGLRRSIYGIARRTRVDLSPFPFPRLPPFPRRSLPSSLHPPVPFPYQPFRLSLAARSRERRSFLPVCERRAAF